MSRINYHRLMSWGVVLAVAFGGCTFVYKLYEFASTAGRAEMPGFALVSIVPYFAATFGFLLLAIWAFLRGHFKDLEGPKYKMLENEKEYDEAERNDTAAND